VLGANIILPKLLPVKIIDPEDEDDSDILVVSRPLKTHYKLVWVFD
jgi:hypothetical protein